MWVTGEGELQQTHRCGGVGARSARFCLPNGVEGNGAVDDSQTVQLGDTAGNGLATTDWVLDLVGQPV